MKPFVYSFTNACLFLACTAESRPWKSINIIGEQSPLSDHMMPSTDTSSTGVVLSDVMGKTQNIAIFGGLTRDVDAVSSRFENAAQKATVLAPDNTAIKNLKRKPWEDPKDYDSFGEQAYKGATGSDRAHDNLERFVKSHIVPESPWEEGRKVNTLAGNEVWWEFKDGQKTIQPGNIEVTSIADKVANGEIWVLGGSVS